MPLKRPTILILSLLGSLPSLFAVLFTPALPQIATEFQKTFGQTQLLMTSFLLGYAIGQLPYGQMSNRFGRKPVLYVGISIAIASCVLSIVAGHLHLFWLFVLARFLMGFGSCAGLNISYTIVGDLFKQPEATRVISSIMFIGAIVPGIATFIGGTITQHWVWEGCFYFLALFGMVLLFFCRSLPETSRHIKEPLNRIVANYRKESKNLPLIYSAVISGCGAGMIYLFAGTAPFIGITLIGLAPENYGILNILPQLGLLCGALFTRKFATSFSSFKIMKAGVGFLLFSSLLMLGLFGLKWLNPWTLFLPMIFIDIGLALLFATTAALALTEAKNKAIGSSLMSFLNLGFGMISVFFIGMLPLYSPLLLPLFFFILTLLILFLIGRLALFSAKSSILFEENESV